LLLFRPVWSFASIPNYRCLDFPGIGDEYLGRFLEIREFAAKFKLVEEAKNLENEDPSFVH